ncbi:hypothetical protein Athai_39640 [Actinocatenispora thailandica]|uniref:Uncharacterized protein n=1 Tax=Actinocatenispora thailandica TaxID=227318 RepID=A0A7R7DRM1_9ACTN|nr:hypothetical protein [Actinocatenispora thailandica]BCJ36461.1 hypothetical protein Athai_39640 [Actinocatenispora thailandica]
MFDTVLDRPVPALRPPVTVRTGGGASLQICDGFVRGTGIVGRFSASPGLLGLKVAAGGPVRVSVVLRADRETATWWEHRVPDSVRPRRPHAARLLLVRSQGATRAAALLTRPRGAFALDATATVRFDLAADELPADGLLVLEIADAAAGTGSLPYAAVGVRIDSVAVEPLPAVGPAVSAEGQVAPAGGSSVEDGLFLVAPPNPDPVRYRWVLRAAPQPPAAVDPVTPQYGPLWQEPPTGAPPLRYRDKGIALARRRYEAARFAALRRLRRTTLRTGRTVTAPVRYATAPATVRAALAEPPVVRLVPLDGGAPRPCRVHRRGGELAVEYSGRLAGPAVVRIETARPLDWRLRRTEIDPVPAVTPELSGDAEANRELLQRLLAGPAAIRLPAGEYPVAGGLTVPADATLRGDPAGTTLVQPVAAEAPLLHVLGSRVLLADLTLRLPDARPGPHDGDRWTAVTVGRYFYPERPDWIDEVELRGLAVRRAGRCPANSVAVLGAVRDLTVDGLSVSGGGTGLAVHWGAVGTDVTELTGPSYHPYRLRLRDVRVADAFEGCYLSSVHDVSLRGLRCTGVEIGFRLLPGDNTDRFHATPGSSPVSSRIEVSDAEVGWCGRYAVRIAGWGRSEVDGRTGVLAYRDVSVAGVLLRAEPPLANDADRVSLVLERAEGVAIHGVRLAGAEVAEVRRDDVPVTLDALAHDRHDG